MKKLCGGCKLEKPFDDFNKCKTGRFGLHNHCRMCQKLTKRKYYLLNTEKEKTAAKYYAKTDKAKAKRGEYYYSNREVILEKNRTRRATPHARKLANLARKRNLETNIVLRITISQRNRIKYALLRTIKGFAIKGGSTIDLLGCSPEFLKTYLESKFRENMSWDNYGYRGWHIDHIIPCSSFDLSKIEEQKKCFHYTNLQPLWWKDNISKGNKILQ